MRFVVLKTRTAEDSDIQHLALPTWSPEFKTEGMAEGTAGSVSSNDWESSGVEKPVEPSENGCA